ncbi:hypothetical protein C8N25_12135 [Algoriphagus antarcticus]|uniref:Uncharacterized protein n=1 Tax=Algoriphagus antarcticus TaxID=238540 RepID=A0A3E0DIK5_9BACT|nr:hypothetical protein C8N25_12135 [Algoriphagus antarcticus]
MKDFHLIYRQNNKLTIEILLLPKTEKMLPFNFPFSATSSHETLAVIGSSCGYTKT